MSTAIDRIHTAAMRVLAEKGGSTVAISDLAREAGLSRGTIYNNLEEPATLFDAVCDMVAGEMADRLQESVSDLEDPAARLSNVIRLCVRRVHEEPHWGRFVARYAVKEPKLSNFWGRFPARELHRGIESGRFDLGSDQVASVAGTLGGATFGAMTLVLHGHRSWRQAGSDAAEVMLRGIGIEKREARLLAAADFDPLPRMLFSDAA
ncbi:TetR/AcrR family transcriptional regulator [Chachezhania antarctica]|uniref:TetR/AcrR family transcriptional regulator n=1 Tax=Chachezhania antarctica TaxID=2340860 RepID=UPI000EB3CD52|nr:TetR/AcrR family transcriptional regulator [Chachezhania antarctica]|tara:strand:- start:13992 stop:14612 length:621 start_codon:yes stop_codon:yes gene_type:complete